MSRGKELLQQYLILFIILPISFVIWVRDEIQKRGKRTPTSSEEEHQERVSRIMQQMKQWRSQPEPRRKLRTGRPASKSHSVRTSNKSDAFLVNTVDLVHILRISDDCRTVRVEPGVTVGHVTKHLLLKDLMLEATLEMEDATLGGLALAQGMTTHSHVCGLVADTVVAFEIIDGNGNLLRASASENVDVFNAAGFSHGSLGILVALELRVTKATHAVHLTYTQVPTAQLGQRYAASMAASPPPFFIEAIVFSPTKSVLIEGNPYEAASGGQGTAKPQLNRQALWWKPWFFKRVETVQHKEEEIMPMYDYLLRHDKSMCMTMETICPQANAPWFRYLFGWLTPPKVEFLKSLRDARAREESIKGQVYQDLAFPAQSFDDIYHLIQHETSIFPLLVYPCQIINRGGFIQGNKGLGQRQLFMNLGVYGIPSALKQGKPFRTLHFVRKLEAAIRFVGGFQHSYCDVLQTVQEFREMFHHELADAVRERTGGAGVFPSVFDKIRPEVPVEKWLQEEIQESKKRA